jgi:hypothetical protein
MGTRAETLQTKFVSPKPRPAAISNSWAISPANLLLKAPFGVEKPQSSDFVVTFWLIYVIILRIQWRLYPSA